MTHQLHFRVRARAAALMRAQQAEDRRHYQRFEQHGLMVRVGDKLLEVHDISVGGIRVSRLDLPLEAEAAMTLFPRDGRQLELSRAMAVRGKVVGHVGQWTRLRFVSLSYTLAKFLIQHLAQRQGVEPYIFK